jgi:hypothetical protein
MRCDNIGFTLNNLSESEDGAYVPATPHSCGGLHLVWRPKEVSFIYSTCYSSWLGNDTATLQSQPLPPVRVLHLDSARNTTCLQ